MQKMKLPFPVDLVNRTPATVRYAFWQSPTICKELTSQAGDINITSVLTKIIQTAGRFGERYVSDLLYSLDRIRALMGPDYVLDRDFDEIVVMGIRKDGVDGESFFMSRLADTVRMQPGNAGLWDGFARPEGTYRCVLGCHVWASCSRYDGLPKMGCELRNMTNSFLHMNRADFDADGKLMDPNYPEGNPIPIDPYTKQSMVEPDTSRNRGDDGKSLCRMDVVEKDGIKAPVCSACGHRFELDYAADPEAEAYRIAFGAFMYCPHCGARYDGCRIEGVDFEECDEPTRKMARDKLPRPKTTAAEEKE